MKKTTALVLVWFFGIATVIFSILSTISLFSGEWIKFLVHLIFGVINILLSMNFYGMICLGKVK
jgi:hypothetical protein